MKDLSPKQNETMDFIRDYREKNGYSPTYAEIAIGMGKHPSTIKACIDEMCKKGFLKVVPGAGRTITIVRA